MTAVWPRGLLVSVRDAEEARLAVAGGAAIVDVKEPRNGPLGRASAEVVAAVSAVVADRVPLTIACGELAAGDDILRHVAAAMRLAPRDAPLPMAVKAGPAGLTLGDWQTSFGRLRDGLPAGIDAVAVAYADWRRADSPPPDELLTAAIRSGAAAILVDTFDKQGPGLFATIPPGVVEAWRRAADTAGLPLAVAGRLAASDVREAFGHGVPIVGVRSAACDGGRDGRIAAPRVRMLAKLGFETAARSRPTSQGVRAS